MGRDSKGRPYINKKDYETMLGKNEYTGKYDRSGPEERDLETESNLGIDSASVQPAERIDHAKLGH